MRPALKSLKDWGAHIRNRRPKTGGFSIQHEKTWIFDRAMYFCGSMNATNNSVNLCEEAMLSTRCAAVVDKAITHFEGIWDNAHELIDEEYEAKPRKSSKSSTTPKASDDD